MAREVCFLLFLGMMEKKKLFSKLYIPNELKNYFASSFTGVDKLSKYNYIQIFQCAGTIKVSDSSFANQFNTRLILLEITDQ